MEPSSIQAVTLPPSLCQDLMQCVRECAGDFRHIDKEEEPPLRNLDHGLLGEGVDCEEAPYPYMIRSKDGLWYHGYRSDLSVCDEACHTSSQLRRLFGSEGGGDREASFRQVLGYASSGNEPQFKPAAKDVVQELEKVLKPAALSVYSDGQIARLFSVYVNALTPGQTIGLHVDVPEFPGIDRSNCPSWLLVAAHCSGLFSSSRVKNVTCVCYPLSNKCGTLAIFHPSQGGLNKIEGGRAVLLDTDTYFHHSEMASRYTEVLHLPDKSNLEFVKEEDKMIWRVKQREQTIAEFPEEDIRFSVSYKFHVFNSKEEEEKFYSRKDGDRLTPKQVIGDMLDDLRRKGKLPDGWNNQDTPLHKLAPVLIREYILPLSPTSSDIETMWEPIICQM